MKPNEMKTEIVATLGNLENLIDRVIERYSGTGPIEKADLRRRFSKQLDRIEFEIEGELSYYGKEAEI